MPKIFQEQIFIEEIKRCTNINYAFERWLYLHSTCFDFFKYVGKIVVNNIELILFLKNMGSLFSLRY